MKKQELLRQFICHQPAAYSQAGLQHLPHLRSTPLREAAVLVPFIEKEHELFVVLTKRALHLPHHPGEVSFPGGKFEEEDLQLSQTALREAKEEIGLSREKIDIIGQLPPLATISQFKVTPFLGLVQQGYQYQKDPNEVDSIFEVPASYLFDPQYVRYHHFTLKGRPYKIYAIPYQDHFIWGVTAQIIRALQKQLIAD